jgi:DNA-binding NtrC family response regulator
MAPVGGTIAPEHLSADLTAPAPAANGPSRVSLRGGQTLASVVDEIERDLIRDMLAGTAATSPRPARSLGLTRRGLYLKLRRPRPRERSDVITK